MCTSIYLDGGGFEILASLSNSKLVKTRCSIDLGGCTGAVDRFHEELDGLLLLEVELGHPDLVYECEPPDCAGADITREEAFTGG